MIYMYTDKGIVEAKLVPMHLIIDAVAPGVHGSLKKFKETMDHDDFIEIVKNSNLEVKVVAVPLNGEM